MEKSRTAITQVHTIEDVCQIVSIGRTLLYEEIKKGRLIARKLGSKTLIFDRDLQAWLESLPATKEVETDHA